MVKGGPLAFLNKKPWHPARFQNQEEVWKREQNAAAEQKKLEELRKQYEEERKNEEMLGIAKTAGVLKDTGRLDWMYAGSLAAKEDAAKRQEEALLGKRTATLADTAPPGEVSRAEVAAQLPSILAGATTASQNEQWNRLTNDPLLLIKKQQIEALKRVRENPVKMQQILQEVRQEKEKGKKHKKDKHKRRSRSRSRSSDSSGDERKAPAAAPAGPPPGAPVYKPVQQVFAARGEAAAPGPYSGTGGSADVGRKRGRSRSPVRGAEAPSSRHAAAGERERDRGGYGGVGGRDMPRDRDGAREGRHEERRADVREERQYDRRDNRDRRDAPAGPRSTGREEREGRDERRGDGRRHEGDRERRPREDREGGREEVDRSRDRDNVGRGGDGDRGRDGHRGRDTDHDRAREQQRHGAEHAQAGSSRRRSEEEEGHGHGNHPTQHAQHGQAEPSGGQEERGATKYGYGLSQNKLAPDAVKSYDGSARAAETRTRLEEAARKKAEEERAAAAQKYQRKEYRTGRLTEEERAAKLAEMSGNAVAHDAGRLARVAAATAAEAKRDEGAKAVASVGGVAGSAREGDAFLGAASRDVYGALSGANLEARVNSRRHFSSK